MTYLSTFENISLVISPQLYYKIFAQSKKKNNKKHLPALLSAAGVNAFVNFFFVACVNGSAFQFNDDWPHLVLCCFAQFVLHMRTFILFYFYGFAADCRFLSAYARCCWCCCVCCCCCQSTM